MEQKEAYGVTMAEYKQSVHLLIDSEILKDLDDYRFKHRVNRADAIQWLLAYALVIQPKFPESCRPTPSQEPKP